MAELKLPTENLYAYGRIIQLNDTEQLLQRDLLVWNGAQTDKYHILKEGDRLDLLAYQYWNKVVENSSKYWWVIADVNGIQNPLELSEYVGMQLVIPDIEKVILQIASQSNNL